MSFGTYLKSIRKGLMTQRELAKKVGVGVPYISKIENNIEPPPSDEVLLKISEALQADTDEIFMQAERVPLDLKNYLIQNPESIRLLRLIYEEDAAHFLLDNFEKILSYRKNEGITLWIDPETYEIIDASKEATKFYQYPLDELKKIKITDINISSKDTVACDIDKAKSGFKNEFIFQHRLKNSEVRKMRVKSVPIKINGKTYLKSTAYEIKEMD